MPAVSITLFQTPVSEGVASADSTRIALTFNDLNHDDIINSTEWQSQTGNLSGQIPGDTGPVSLWDGDTESRDSSRTGTLYTSTPLHGGDSVSALIDNTRMSNVRPTVAALNVCFLAGTMIETPSGEVPVETLRPGDMVLTRDHGAQPLIWTHATRVTPAHLDLAPNKRPVRIEAGALGDGLPRRDVDVSPQHRVLVTDAEGTEYLISARHLMMAGTPGVALRPSEGDFQLVHIAFGDHEVVVAEGSPMESFYTGKMAVRALSVPQRLSLIACFPCIAEGGNPMSPARPFIKHRDYARIRAAFTAE